jgi:hypothetical protein
LLTSQIPHIVKDWDFRPVLSQDGLAELVLLAEGDGSESSLRAKSFEGITEPSDSREEVERFDFIHRLPSLPHLLPKRHAADA